jgi:hypothetical protein
VETLSRDDLLARIKNWTYAPEPAIDVAVWRQLGVLVTHDVEMQWKLSEGDDVHLMEIRRYHMKATHDLWRDDKRIYEGQKQMLEEEETKMNNWLIARTLQAPTREDAPASVGVFKSHLEKIRADNAMPAMPARSANSFELESIRATHTRRQHTQIGSTEYGEVKKEGFTQIYANTFEVGCVVTWRKGDDEVILWPDYHTENWHVGKFESIQCESVEYRYTSDEGRDAWNKMWHADYQWYTHATEFYLEGNQTSTPPAYVPTPEPTRVQVPLPPGTRGRVLAVVEHLKEQVDCGTKRLEGELKDWRAGPVQDLAGGGALKHALEDIVRVLRASERGDLSAAEVQTISTKLEGIRTNLYLQSTYSAVAKTMTETEGSIAVGRAYALAASWGPAIALFREKHPDQDWLPLHELFWTICRMLLDDGV